jgi:thiamine-phosphate pyrophosphorylase
MNPEVLRVIDANANRGREALRVVEDYARFVLDDATISASLKQLRHDLVAVLGSIPGHAILHRDTPGDVGTRHTADTERSRASLAEVVVAAGKRLGEALRAIEEYVKTMDAEAAARIESLRYRFYELEHRLAFVLHPEARPFSEVRLYVLITQSLCRHDWLETAAQAIVGGADCLQLREKAIESGELLDRARRLVELCHRHGVLCIINDRPDIAMLSRADGVHLGQQDLPARQVRKLLGPEKLIGVSTHVIDQARQAVLDGADYIGVGPVFRSATKPRDVLPGLEYARRASAAVRIPAVAIAGINDANVDEVLATGVRAIAVTAAVIAATDVTAAARRLKSRLERSEAGCPKT